MLLTYLVYTLNKGGSNLKNQLDKELTKKATKKILSKYRDFKAYAKAPISPRISMSWGDGMPKSTNVKSNYVDDLMIRAEEGKQFCNWVDWAINSCKKLKYKEILRVVYCDGYETGHTYYMEILSTRLDYYDFSSSTYFKWLDEALLDVAKRLNSEVLQ